MQWRALYGRRVPGGLDITAAIASWDELTVFTVRTQLAIAMSAPARSLATCVQAVASGLARCIQARIDKQGPEAGAAAAG